jgi:hypothetical protein
VGCAGDCVLEKASCSGGGGLWAAASVVLPCSRDKNMEPGIMLWLGFAGVSPTPGPPGAGGVGGGTAGNCGG